MIGIGDEHHVLLLQGGARHQFAMVPYNLLHTGETADYVVTGEWAAQAHSEASLVGAGCGASARIAANTEVDGSYTRVPDATELYFDPEAAYVHLTSNNTLYGTQWAEYPDTRGVPLVVDMTSDLLSRAIDMSRLGVVYAGAQKNVGPAGVTVVIVKKSLVDGARTDIPAVLRYESFAEKDSLWNTPPTFAIYMLRNTLAALNDMGGVAGLEKLNREKARLVYERVDAAPDFFRGPVEVTSRSIMNPVFRLPSEALEKQFLEAASKAGMVGLKGHRSVGGIRASLYNAVELAWVERLCELMVDFQKSHG
jgi:phosphoserine aminotransferase